MRTGLAACVLLVCASVRAEGVSTFTAAGYVRAALEASPEVRQAAALFEASRQAWRSQAAAAWLPTLGAGAGAVPYGHDPAAGYAFRHWSLSRPDLAFQESVNLNLFNSFADYYKTRQAALARETAGSVLDASRQNRAFSAAQSFYDLGLKDRLLDVAVENLKIQKDGYDLTLDLYRNGMKSLADLLKSETDWRSSELLVSQAEAERRRALLQFNLLIDRPADAGAVLEVDLEPGTTVLPGLSVDVEYALSRRPELVFARLAVAAAETAASDAVRAGAPQFSADAAWSRTGNGSRVGNPEPSPNYRLALSLSLPLGFNGASQIFNAASARARAAAARQDLGATIRQVRSEVHSAFIALGQALDAHRIAALKQDIARRNLELVNEQYKQGSADVIRLAQAQLDYLQARTEKSQALFGAFTSRFQYRLAIGEPLWK
ncbi:MAG: TolC family protein [Elusimicrobia bacterium]|nr:TolC family protein [Elusimicrobiota bacterium]